MANWKNLYSTVQSVVRTSKQHMSYSLYVVSPGRHNGQPSAIVLELETEEGLAQAIELARADVSDLKRSLALAAKIASDVWKSV